MINNLTFSMLGKNFSGQHFEIFFYYFSLKTDFDDLHGMSKYISGKNKKKQNKSTRCLLNSQGDWSKYIGKIEYTVFIEKLEKISVLLGSLI